MKNNRLQANPGQKSIGGIRHRGFLAVLLLVTLGLTDQARSEPPRPRVFTSTPLLAQLVKDVGGDAADVVAVWSGNTALRNFKITDDTLSSLKAAVLFLRYGDEPYRNLEDGAVRALPEGARLVTVGVPETKLGSVACATGEKTLDPVWSFFAAEAIAQELTNAFPGELKEFRSNLAALQRRLGQTMFGEEAAKNTDLPRLFRAAAEVPVGSQQSEGSRKPWCRRLSPFAGIPVQDPWRVLGSFCARFGLVPLSAEQLRPETEKLSFPVLVGWEARAGEQPAPAFEVVSVALDPALLRNDDSNGIANQIDSLISALEPALAASKVRRECARPGRNRLVEPPVALTFDERCVPELLSLLADSKNARWWESVILLLGYVGDERACEPLVELMTKRFAGKRVNDETERAILFAARGLGLLAQKSPKALAFVEKASSPRFWRDYVTWEGGVLRRRTTIIGLAGNCIQAVGMSGQRNHAWLMEFAHNQYALGKDDGLRDWLSMVDADCYMWWQEAYGQDRFRLEWRSEKSVGRVKEHWRSERAAELKAFAPKELRLPP